MSALFDEWAYQEIYSVEPAKPAAPELKKEEEAPTSVEVPAPVLRSRARSFHAPSGNDLGAPAAQPRAADAPLGSAQQRKKRDVHAWLGLSSPRRLAFDARVWEARMQPLLLREVEIAAALRRARALASEAQYLLNESEYLAQDLADVHLHDVAPLETHRAELAAVEQKSAFVDHVGQALRMWAAQDEVARALRQPAQRVVGELPELMRKVHEGLAFCAAHPDFVDIAQTELAWRSAAQRGCAVGVAFCTHELRKLCTRSMDRLDAGNRTALLYRKFASDTARVRPVLAVLRAAAAVPELAPFWQDAQASYFRLRAPLVVPLAQEHVRPLLAQTELGDAFFDAFEQALLLFRAFYADETALFADLFDTDTAALAAWLQDLSDPLYAAVRKLTVRETRIEPLCRLVFAVQAEDAVQTELERVAAFHTVYLDAQSRLVFRAELMIDQLAKYQPKPHDFSKERYPTVQQTLTLLSQVYQLLKQKVFNDLAQRCVRECVHSLETAASVSPSVRTHVYHVKQLLVLQSQVVEFDLEHLVVRDVDFSGVWRLLELGRNRSFREVLALAWSSVPRVVEVMYDAMEETYLAFRGAVGRLCALVVQRCFEPPPAYAELCVRFRAEFGSLHASAAELISDRRVIAILVDSVRQAVLDAYKPYYAALTPDQRAAEDVMDDGTMAVWLADVVNAAQ